MIQTKSKFYYGHTINTENNWIDFKEGAGPEISAELNVGEYTLTGFAVEVARALNFNGGQTYTVSVNRATRIVTITAASAFTLLASTGTNNGRSAFDLLGFSSDTSSGVTQVADTASGSEWSPQFMGQDFVDFEDQQSSIDGVTRVSAGGKVEAVKFGTKQIMDVNFKFITDIPQGPNGVIETQANAVLNARTFLKYAITKADLEFIPDRDKPDEYFSCILESTADDKDGLGFKLRELYSQGLVGYYETGLMKFRKI